MRSIDELYLFYKHNKKQLLPKAISVMKTNLHSLGMSCSVDRMSYYSLLTHEETEVQRVKKKKMSKSMQVISKRTKTQIQFFFSPKTQIFAKHAMASVMTYKVPPAIKSPKVNPASYQNEALQRK